MQGTVEVTDRFKGAFLLCMGGRLDQVRIRNNGRRISTFLIKGKDLERFDSDYRTGRALVNLVQLRESLNHLRDVMFEKLRKTEGRYHHANRPRGVLNDKSTAVLLFFQPMAGNPSRPHCGWSLTPHLDIRHSLLDILRFIAAYGPIE